MSILSYPPDKKIQNYQFSFRAKLGKGAYGTVFAGRNTQDSIKKIQDLGQVVALKVIDKKLLQTDYANSLIASEIEIMKKIDNKNIVKLIDVIQSVNNTYIITEYCNGGDLREYLKKKRQLSEADSLLIFKDLLLGIKSLLKIGIIHRDIKPANIMVHDGLFKITDFGFAKQVDSHIDAIMNSLVGTPLYMSPQILKRQKYTSKCDIWSIGLILYELMYGTTPWHSQNLVELMSKLDSKPLLFPPTVRISENTKNIIKSCLQIQEEKRIGWEALFSMAGMNDLKNETSPLTTPHQMSQNNNTFLANKENKEIINQKYSIQTMRIKQRTESMCQYQVTNKHNRSLSNTAFMQMEKDKSPNSNTNKLVQRTKLSYLEPEKNSQRYRTELEQIQDRDRSNSQMRFHTQRIELQKYLENVHTPPIPNKKYGSNKSNNDSFRTPSALQSHSTNASNRNHYEQQQDTVKVNDFQVEEHQKNKKSETITNIDEKIKELEEEEEQNHQSSNNTTRIKRTNSLSNNFNGNLSPLMNQKKGHLLTLFKVIFNQQDLIPNHIHIKQSINQVLIQHRNLINSSQNEQLYSTKEQREIKQLINGIVEYLNKNQGDHFIVQMQVMLLLLLNYNKLIQQNIQTKSFVLTTSLLELIKKNQQIQQNQLHLDPKLLRETINSQLY